MTDTMLVGVLVLDTAAIISLTACTLYLAKKACNLNGTFPKKTANQTR